MKVAENPPDPVGVTRVRVRYGETDQMGVVYHANYLVYFEVGRVELIRELGIAYADLEQQGVRLPVIDVGARFHEPARYDDEIVITTRLTEATAVRLRFEYELTRGNDGRLLARGHSVLASVDDSGRPRRLSREVCERLSLQGPSSRTSKGSGS